MSVLLAPGLGRGWKEAVPLPHRLPTSSRPKARPDGNKLCPFSLPLLFCQSREMTGLADPGLLDRIGVLVPHFPPGTGDLTLAGSRFFSWKGRLSRPAEICAKESILETTCSASPLSGPSHAQKASPTRLPGDCSASPGGLTALGSPQSRAAASPLATVGDTGQGLTLGPAFLLSSQRSSIMQWISLASVMTKYCELPVMNHSHPGQSHARMADQPTPADVGEADNVSWEAAWIDLGGEG
jgi:hypothetical protein